MKKIVFRRIFQRYGLSLAILTAVVFSMLAARPAYLKQRDTNVSAVVRAERYAKAAAREILIECADLIPASQKSCAAEIENAARRDAREELDLAAQQVVAIWTAVVGVMAVLGAALSGVAAYLIWQTWSETRRAAGMAEKTHAAFLAAEGAKLVVRAVLRQSLNVTNIMYELEVTNVGKGTCVITELHKSWRADADFKSDDGRWVLGAHAVLSTTETKGLALSNFPRDNLKDTPFLGGWITYESPVNRRHISYFCFEIFSTKEVGHPFILRAAKNSTWPDDR